MGMRPRHRVITAQFVDKDGAMNIHTQDDDVTPQKGDTEHELFRRAVQEVADMYGVPYKGIGVLFYRCVPNEIPW